jgi:hypothetical protein
MKIRKQMKTTMSLAAAMGTLALATSAQAATPITVLEHSFEGAKALGGWTGAGAGAGESVGAVPSPWIVTGGQGTGWTIASQYSGGIPDGDIYAYMNAAGNTRQTLAATLQADTDYTLTVATGWRADLPGLGFGTYPGYGIELYAGTTLIASDYDTVSGAPALDSWKDATATYSYDAGDAGLVGQALEIRLIGYGIQSNYDNVRLDFAAVPEPSSAALLGLGGLALILRRRK